MFADKSTDSISLREEIQSKIADLNLEDLKALREWLKGAIKQRKAEETLKALTAKKGREVVETRVAGKTTYQLEKVKCGKKKCKCKDGKLHGPYWYAYSWNGKKLTSHYIGKQFKTLEENEDGSALKPAASV